MEKESYLNKIWRHWIAMWNKITWLEIIILFVLGKAFLFYIALNHAHYYVECENQTVEEIFPHSTELCGREVFVQREISFWGVDWEIHYMDESQDQFMQDSIAEYLNNKSKWN